MDNLHSALTVTVVTGKLLIIRIKTDTFHMSETKTLITIIVYATPDLVVSMRKASKYSHVVNVEMHNYIHKWIFTVVNLCNIPRHNFYVFQTITQEKESVPKIYIVQKKVIILQMFQNSSDIK